MENSDSAQESWAMVYTRKSVWSVPMSEIQGQRTSCGLGGTSWLSRDSQKVGTSEPQGEHRRREHSTGQRAEGLKSRVAQ